LKAAILTENLAQHSKASRWVVVANQYPCTGSRLPWNVPKSTL
jgi:hypothetical protein